MIVKNKRWIVCSSIKYAWKYLYLILDILNSNILIAVTHVSPAYLDIIYSIPSFYGLVLRFFKKGIARQTSNLTLCLLTKFNQTFVVRI